MLIYTRFDDSISTKIIDMSSSLFNQLLQLKNVQFKAWYSSAFFGFDRFCGLFSVDHTLEYVTLLWLLFRDKDAI